MRTEVIQFKGSASSGEAVRKAADVILSGGLVAFPTETVYGVGANVADSEALARLRTVKNRENRKPFTVHISGPSEAARFVPSVSRLGKRLMVKGWPGPLTLVFQVEAPESAPIMKDLAADRLTDVYYEGSVGIRCPDHPAATNLLARVRVPVVAASANLAGNPAPTTPDEVLHDLDGRIDLLIDAGRVRFAKPSTIVQLNGNGYRILREGVWDERTVKRLATTHFLFVCTGNTCRSPMAAGLCRQILAERLGCRADEVDRFGFEVQSAGVFAMPGGRAQESAVRVLARRGIDLSHHFSQPLSVELIHQADYIYAMTRSHLETIVSMVPSAAERVRTLQEHSDIEDPLDSGDEVYQTCAERMALEIRKRLAEIAI